MLDFMALANTKLAGELGKGLGSALGGGGPVTSQAGSIDGRGFLDGSGWTVSTGHATASGGDRRQDGDPWGAPSNAAAAPQQAGIGIAGFAALVLLAMAVKGKL